MRWRSLVRRLGSRNKYGSAGTRIFDDITVRTDMFLGSKLLEVQLYICNM
jgi:hypothetical protein